MEVDGLIRVVATDGARPVGRQPRRSSTATRPASGWRRTCSCTFAKTVRVEPIRTIASTLAGVTRDVGAAQLSVARWFLDD